MYFEQIRDSLRNVLLDIEKCLEQQNVLYSESFWRDFIGKAVATKKTETQVWDFKETFTMWPNLVLTIKRALQAGLTPIPPLALSDEPRRTSRVY